MKKCSMYFDMRKNDFILTCNEKKNVYCLTKIESLKDICKNVNSSEKMNLENYKFLFSFELTCQVESDDIAIEGPKIKTVEISKNLKEIVKIKEMISQVEEKINKVIGDLKTKNYDLFILDFLFGILSIFLLFTKVQNNVQVPAIEYSKIDTTSEAFKSLDNDIQTTITNYINEQSDKIVNAALKEDKQKQIQSVNSDLKV